MSLELARNKFLEIMKDIKADNERNIFLKWIRTNWGLDCLPGDDLPPKEILYTVAEEIRSMVPFEAILPSEKIILPVCGPNSDCESKTTVHVDEFLYSDEYIDELVDKGLMSRYYCGDCFSKNTKLLTFISHSMSINRIQYLFRCLLPPLKNQKILDIGSRLGGVLYGAYIYTSNCEIIGVEINADFCKIQNDVIKKFNFSNRIRIICNSIFNEIELLSSADVIILNNVFEFFSDVDTAIASWHLLAQNIKVGCTIVTVPHLKDTFQYLKVDFNWKDWVEELPPYQEISLFDEEDMDNHRQSVKHYKVKHKFDLLKNKN